MNLKRHKNEYAVNSTERHSESLSSILMFQHEEHVFGDGPPQRPS